jgi:hypothetical protein
MGFILVISVIKQFIQNKKYKTRITAGGLALLILACAIIPQKVSGWYINGLNMFENGAVKPTWDESITQAWLDAHKSENEDYGNYEATALYFNTMFYYAIKKWPLGGIMYLSKRDGYTQRGVFDNFEGRQTFCTGNHQSAVGITPGARAYCSGEYQIGKEIFKEARHGNEEFNFLMLTIACNYPGKYELPSETGSSAECPYAASQAVMQAIAWDCTNQGAKGFVGDWEQDFAYFKSDYGYYNMLLGDVFQPEDKIYEGLAGKPAPESGAAQHGMTNMVEGMFYDVWHAAKITSLLTPNWDKEMATWVSPMKEENGEHVVEIEIPNDEGLSDYLTGIQFTPYGDWKQADSGSPNIMKFTSISGETDENESIGTLSWPETVIGGLAPVDPTKAHLYTFDIYNMLEPANGAFGRTQTQFASYIETGLTVYVTIGEPTDDGGGGDGVVRHKHEELWDATYNVNLDKFDSETGKALEGSKWDILEKFDDSQLDNTDLDRVPSNPGEYDSSFLGELIPTEYGTEDISANYSGDLGVNMSDSNKYNWKNDNGTQFQKWMNPLDDPCKDDEHITGKDGKLYYIDSSGSNSNDLAHSDTRKYTYTKGYCDGHPAPEHEYIECDHDEDEDCDCDEKNQEIHDQAWKEWYEEVKVCEELVKEGGFFHSITPGLAKEEMQKDRDQFYKDYISLTYDYSAVETDPAKGYTLHGNHTDDIPLEWRVVT